MKKHKYSIVRLSYNDPYSLDVTPIRIMDSQEKAQKEVVRLNKLHKDMPCEYAWTRLKA
jgi:hypothetical protein